MIRCPFHNDHVASMYVTSDRAYCFACHKSYPPYLFVKTLENKQFADIVGMSGDYGPPKPPSVLPARKPDAHAIEIAHKALMNSKCKLDYLIKERGLAKRIVVEYKIGYCTPPFRKYKLPRYVFPTWDADGVLVTAGYRQDPHLVYDDVYPENKKYVIHNGTASMLYNAHRLPGYGMVVHCGGQIDALSLLQYGINATGAMGEGTFKREWASLYEGKRVYILMDNDEAGRLAAQKIAGRISGAVILTWPEGVPDKYDVNAAINDKEFGIVGINGMLRRVGCH